MLGNRAVHAHDDSVVFGRQEHEFHGSAGVFDSNARGVCGRSYGIHSIPLCRLIFAAGVGDTAGSFA
jgi:hypothetical protein